MNEMISKDFYQFPLHRFEQQTLGSLRAFAALREFPSHAAAGCSQSTVVYGME